MLDYLVCNHCTNSTGASFVGVGVGSLLEAGFVFREMLCNKDSFYQPLNTIQSRCSPGPQHGWGWLVTNKYIEERHNNKV
jgi:hypothetical protein